MRVPIELLLNDNAMGTLNITTLFSIGIGFFTLMAYIIQSIRKKKASHLNLTDGLSLFLSGVMIPQGFYIGILGLNAENFSCVDIYPPFLTLCGITIVWLSIERIIKVFTAKLK